MNIKNVDIAIIGGGPAGLAAAVSAWQYGVKNIVIIERNSWLGGILQQCIHDGFGVEEMKQSMTGPEYASEYIKEVMEKEISIMYETMVLNISQSHEIIAMNQNGMKESPRLNGVMCQWRKNEYQVVVRMHCYQL